MEEKFELYLGLLITFICGFILTPIFFVVVVLARVIPCLWSIIVDTFLFTPRIAQNYENQFWRKQAISKAKKRD